MKIKNLITNTFPIILHAPGPKYDPLLYKKQNPLWDFALNKLSKSKPKNIGITNDLTILTWNSTTVLSPLEKSLERLGIPIMVLGKDITDFKRPMKIDLTVNALEKIRTKYVLGLDCFDVIVTGDPSIVVDHLRSSSVKMIFNAETKFWPDCGENHVTERWKALQDKRHVGKYRYLNAGVWVGEREFVKNFYKVCQTFDHLKMIKGGLLPTKQNDPLLLEESEQVIVLWAYSQFNQEITIDENCDVFQNIVFHDESEVLIYNEIDKIL